MGINQKTGTLLQQIFREDCMILKQYNDTNDGHDGLNETLKIKYKVIEIYLYVFKIHTFILRNLTNFRKTEKAV